MPCRASDRGLGLVGLLALMVLDKFSTAAAAVSAARPTRNTSIRAAGIGDVAASQQPLAPRPSPDHTSGINDYELRMMSPLGNCT